MIIFNKAVSPDCNATATNPDGSYNFTCVASEENDVVLSLIEQANNYPPNQRNIALTFFSEDTTYKPRYIVNQIIIEYAKLTGEPLDKIAEYIAYSRKSSAYRGKAISTFEQLDKNISFPKTTSGYPMYSWGRLYLIAAELYEKEYQFEKALQSIDSSQKNGWNKMVCVERHAEILAKIDISQAVKFLRDKIEADPTLGGLSGVLCELQAKSAKGYKFKPRRKTDEDNLEVEQQIRRLAYRYLVKI